MVGGVRSASGRPAARAKTVPENASRSAKSAPSVAPSPDTFPVKRRCSTPKNAVMIALAHSSTSAKTSPRNSNTFLTTSVLVAASSHGRCTPLARHTPDCPQ